MDSEHVAGEKYILCRREGDGFNEVIKAGPKAPSAIGLVDFKTFIEEHSFHPLELAQLLKISHRDMQLIADHGGWIEPHMKANLLQLSKITCSRGRRDMCKFLMVQDGKAGSRNVPQKDIDVDRDVKLK